MNMNTHWLVEAPADINQQIDEIPDTKQSWLLIEKIVKYKLNLNQLVRLSNVLKRMPEEEFKGIPVTIAILSNATKRLIEQILPVVGFRFGLVIEVVSVDYGQVMQEAVSPDSAMYKSKLDYVLIALDHRAYQLVESHHLKNATTLLDGVRSGVRKNSEASCIFQTIARPEEPLFGNLDRRVKHSDRSLITDINQLLIQNVEIYDEYLLDVEALSENIGLSNWHDEKQWNMAKFPFSQKYIPLYADNLCRLISAVKGKSRRCIVLDLDNTLWGGVIGDDGLDGIAIGQGDIAGESFLSFQNTLLKLRDRGIVLAVCSKNDERIAKQVFLEHPEMLIKMEHIASFKANWNDKASNIKAIAEELSLGLDSFVFVDDNPMERELVRNFLPMVAVPEMPNDPSLYTNVLLSAGYFESVVFSGEDKLRADTYQKNQKRKSLLSESNNLDEFLHSLEMELDIQMMDSISKLRVVQLINKSNQFNLTTRRYTLQQIEKMDQEDDTYIIQVRLKDSFGDSGIISVVICKNMGNDLVIDTWVMSCRVLGRRVEEAVIVECSKLAKDLKCSNIVGNYIFTDRNSIVKELYRKLGFSNRVEEKSGNSTWSVIAQDILIDQLPFKTTQVKWTPSQ
jgi:FkbH-like protein